MKKIFYCFLVIVVILLLILSDCVRYHYIKAEPGSYWASEDSSFRMEIINHGYAEGMFMINGDPVEIEACFGPGKRDYIVFCLGENDGSKYLFLGDYYYSEKKGTITFKLEEDQVGLGTRKIILYKQES